MRTPSVGKRTSVQSASACDSFRGLAARSVSRCAVGTHGRGPFRADQAPVRDGSGARPVQLGVGRCRCSTARSRPISRSWSVCDSPSYRRNAGRRRWHIRGSDPKSTSPVARPPAYRVRRAPVWVLASLRALHVRMRDTACRQFRVRVRARSAGIRRVCYSPTHPHDLHLQTPITAKFSRATLRQRGSREVQNSPNWRRWSVSATSVERYPRTTRAAGQR